MSRKAYIGFLQSNQYLADVVGLKMLEMTLNFFKVYNPTLKKKMLQRI